MFAFLKGLLWEMNGEQRDESVENLLFLTGRILHIEILVMGWRPIGAQSNCKHQRWSYSASSQQFQVPFKFFPKSFAFFPNGAWLLSASRRCRYLASHGIYHPLWAALPSNPTRRKRSVCRGLPDTDRILTLYDALFYTLHFAAPKRHRDALLHHPQLPLTAIVP